MKLVYVTSNPNKQEEIDIIKSSLLLDDDRLVGDVFDFDIRTNSIPERLEIDLELLVRDEAARAYEVVRVPCIVEHAGLIFDDYRGAGYPGGLTKPMWNALGSDFLASVRLRNRGATAKAVVGYCDGMKVATFPGCTHGRLSKSPRGMRQFYWDTVFVPDDPSRPKSQLTYAQIVDHRSLGLRYKVLQLSQSTKAIRACLQYIRTQEPNLLWR